MTNKPAEVRGTTRGLRRVGRGGGTRAREREREENTDETRARAPVDKRGERVERE